MFTLRPLLIILTFSLTVLALSGGLQPTNASTDIPPVQAIEPEEPNDDAAIIVWEYDQIRPTVAFSPQANVYLAVWEDHHWGFGNDWDIYVRRVAADGAMLGDPFAISWLNDKPRMRPDVVYNSVQNEFLVVWEHGYASGDHDIYARRVASDGSLLGNEVPIATSTDLDGYPAVAYNPIDNQYLVVWERSYQVEPFSGRVIYSQRLDANLNPLGTSILLETGTPWFNYNAWTPDVAFGWNPAGYLVVWAGGSITDEVVFDIVGQRVAPNGSLVQGKIGISTYRYDQLKPRLAFNPTAKEFLVVWEDHYWGGGTDWDINGRRIRPDGSPVSNEFAISWLNPQQRVNPDVIYQPATLGYVVAWEYRFSSGPENWDIHWRRLGVNGELYENPIILAQRSTYEGHPMLACTDQLYCLFVWEDKRSDLPGTFWATDIYGESVFVGYKVFSPYVYKRE